MNRKVFQKIPESKDGIYNSLFNHHKYYVKSKVHLENFQSFLKYWEDGTFPKIENENIMEFYQLYIEFGFLDEYFDSPKFKKPLFNLSYLIDSEKNGSSLRAEIEKEIAQSLDDYINNFSNDLQKVPITSLYNIFGHPNRNLKNLSRKHQKIKIKIFSFYLTLLIYTSLMMLRLNEIFYLIEKIILDSFLKIQKVS